MIHLSSVPTSGQSCMLLTLGNAFTITLPSCLDPRSPAYTSLTSDQMEGLKAWKWSVSDHRSESRQEDADYYHSNLSLTRWHSDKRPTYHKGIIQEAGIPEGKKEGRYHSQLVITWSSRRLSHIIYYFLEASLSLVCSWSIILSYPLGWAVGEVDLPQKRDMNTERNGNEGHGNLLGQFNLGLRPSASRKWILRERKTVRILRSSVVLIS